MRKPWVNQVLDRGRTLLSRSRDGLEQLRAGRSRARGGGSSGDPMERAVVGTIVADGGDACIEADSIGNHAPEVDFEAALLNQALPNYEILGTLDHGGQGIVYRALQRSTGRVVALKVLLVDPGTSRRREQRFAREVELVSRLRHPHVVTIFDSGVAAGRPYLSMELIDGLSIDDYVLLNRPTVRECVVLFEKICRAVAAVHQRGVIHRDLKPSNIRVDLEGEPHILDFGLAKCADDEDGRQSLSVAGQVVGTLPFLSPEQITGDDGGVDIRTDIYALGVILYLLLTGEMPYPIDGPRPIVAHNIVNHLPARLDRRVRVKDESGAIGVISSDLSHVVLKALAKEKDRRYQSADAMADDLRRYLDGDGVAARGDGFGYLLRVAWRKYRVHSMVAAAFVLLLAGSAVGMAVLWQRADQMARDVTASLHMDRDLKLGSIARDENRIDDAIRSCENAISVFAKIRNPTVEDHRAHYAAHHDLAQIYFQRDDKINECRHHTDMAIQIAESLADLNPDEPQFRRLLAFASRLAGRVALKSGQWDLAQEEFVRSSSLFRSLSSSETEKDNAPIEFEALFSEQFLAQSLVLGGKSSEGRELFQQVRNRLIRICELYPRSMDYLMELARTETLFAADLMRTESNDDYQRAQGLLVIADQRIQQAITTGMANSRLPAAQKLEKSIRENRSRVERKLRAIETNQAGSSSPSGTSAGPSSSLSTGSGSSDR